MTWAATSTEVDKVCSALVKALGGLDDIVKDRTANAGTYSYSYADLATAMGVARPALAAQGLVVSQVPSSDGREVRVATMIVHESGQWLAYPPLGMPAGGTAQQAGSAISYARRYSLMAVLGLATEDDDGAGAGHRDEHPRQQVDTEAVRVFQKLKSAAEVNPPVAEDVQRFASLNKKGLTVNALSDPEWRQMVETALAGLMDAPADGGQLPIEADQ